MMDFEDMRAAREQLRANVMAIDPQAVEFIDYDAFEGVLEAVLMTPNPTNEMIHRVFTASIMKARTMRAIHRPLGPTH